VGNVFKADRKRYPRSGGSRLQTCSGKKQSDFFNFVSAGRGLQPNARALFAAGRRQTYGIEPTPTKLIFHLIYNVMGIGHPAGLI
jgi:hypothetical protein